MADSLNTAATAAFPAPQIERDWQRIAFACEYMKLSRSGLYKKSKTEKDFPQPVRLGHRHTVYCMNEIRAYMETRRGATTAPELRSDTLQ